MRKPIAMMLLALVSSSAAAEWVKVDETETSTDYADPATIRRTGNIVKMWSLHDYKTVVLVDKGKPFKSTRTQSEYDCKGERLRMISMSFYARNMARGVTVHRDADPDKWEPVERGTIAESLWKIACGK